MYLTFKALSSYTPPLRGTPLNLSKGKNYRLGAINNNGLWFLKQFYKDIFT